MSKIRLILSIICHRYFDTNHFITWFLFWGQPIDSAGGGGGGGGGGGSGSFCK